MNITRMDLDGTYSPFGLVAKILAAEPNLKIPVPVEDLAQQFDITDIEELTTDGFEGGLVTNKSRHSGIILVKKNAYRQRRRFTIGHELCHFLNIHHEPASGDAFMCDKDAMKAWGQEDQRKAFKMEAEANRFSSLLLIPPPHLRKILHRDKYAKLDTVLEIHEHFDVSKDAAARAFAEYNPENVAIVIARNGRYLRSYPKKGFPWINLRGGDPIPNTSALFRGGLVLGKPTRIEKTESDPWLGLNKGAREPKMYEQAMLQQNGFAMVLLKIANSEDNDYDPEERMTSKQRLASRIERRARF